MKNKPLNIIDKIINSEVVGDTLFLHLYGYLGEGPDRISFQDVFSQVNNKAEQVKNIVVKLNSGGGCLFTGLAIKDYLEKFKSKVSIHVEGMAASAASFIALAGKELLMSPTSRFMIHNPYIPSIEMNKGDAKEFQQVASSLFKDENMMIKIYSEKTGKTPEEIKSMMDEETTC
jgi:ATP-dependent Clp protease protease subunit